MTSQRRSETLTSEDEALHSPELVGGGVSVELSHPNQEEQGH